MGGDQIRADENQTGGLLTGTPLGSGPEFDRIRAIADILGADAAALGDDTALIPEGPGRLVISTDSSIEGIHFRTGWLTDSEIGWRAAMAALSDLAGSGARPVGMLAALSLPPGSSESLVTDLMRGVSDAGRVVGCPVLGGDLTGGPVIALCITVLGRVETLVGRGGAEAGDGIWVTGTLGGARAALSAWQSGRAPSPGARVAFARPMARIRAGGWLAAQGARSMLDLSDGLAGDIRHLAAASDLGMAIELERLPVHLAVHSESELLGENRQLFAARGGEDYELLVVMPSEWNSAELAESATGSKLSRIGRVTASAGVTLTLEGEIVEIDGFQHQ